MSKMYICIYTDILRCIKKISPVQVRIWDPGKGREGDQLFPPMRKEQHYVCELRFLTNVPAVINTF